VNEEGHNVKFEVLTAVTVDNHTLWSVAGDFSETLMYVIQTAWFHIPEHSFHHKHTLCLKVQLVMMFSMDQNLAVLTSNQWYKTLRPENWSIFMWVSGVLNHVSVQCTESCECMVYWIVWVSGVLNRVSVQCTESCECPVYWIVWVSGVLNRVSVRCTESCECPVYWIKHFLTTITV
jgi:hypothetical protein